MTHAGPMTHLATATPAGAAARLPTARRPCCCALCGSLAARALAGPFLAPLPPAAAPRLLGSLRRGSLGILRAAIRRLACCGLLLCGCGTAAPARPCGPSAPHASAGGILRSLLLGGRRLGHRRARAAAAFGRRRLLLLLPLAPAAAAAPALVPALRRAILLLATPRPPLLLLLLLLLPRRALLCRLCGRRLLRRRAGEQHHVAADVILPWAPVARPQVVKGLDL